MVSPNLKNLTKAFEGEVWPSIQLKEISVIVAVRNEAENLKSCLDSLLVAAEGQAEIIVVNDSSIDATPTILKNYEDSIRVILGEGRGPGRARNKALGGLSRPFVAFTDGDVRVPADWLRQLAEGLSGQNHNVAAIGGGQAVFSDAGPSEVRVANFFSAVGFVSDYVHGGSEVRKVKHNPTCNVLYSREALSTVQGFDETLWPCEDLELDIRLSRAGRSFLFHPKAAVEHRRPTSFMGLLSMMKRYGFAHAQLVKKHGICQPLHLLPGLLLALGIWPVYLFFKHPLHFWSVLAIVLACALFFFSKRTGSVMSGGRTVVWAALASGVWTWGFLSGIWGHRRIVETHA